MMTRANSRSPWTTLLGDVVDKDHRTTNARKLLRTMTGCTVVLFVTIVGAAGAAYLWGGGALLVGITVTLTGLTGGTSCVRWMRRGTAGSEAPPADGPPP